jgi:hypothetical protein
VTQVIWRRTISRPRSCPAPSAISSSVSAPTHLRWRTFCANVIELAQRCQKEMIVAHDGR